ncbi:hypothetical protein AVJ23_20020 [Pseudoponticoccus marisrubri]|uniref:Uncharacterized protein n=1 Tax=Pseudoponticoccus marisrubri TaxID=1685382 RepID=A0A0W7WEK0_9RHOB|nr:hypothetical protein AVJ23_20020 [Pseudoponticoccus marisrubri]
MTRPRDPIGQSGSALWNMVLRAWCTRHPPLASLARETAARTVLELAPDMTRHPRPFTLHDIGGGRPYVSCACDGTPADLIRLAHEFGHAMQVIASGPAGMPPALRETCAYLSEAVTVRGVRAEDPGLAALIGQVRAAEAAQDLGSRASRLRQALADPDRPYDYDWNYPVARILSERLSAGGEAVLHGVFHGRYGVPDLLDQGATVVGIRTDNQADP